MEHQKINEDCGCGASGNPTISQTSPQPDPNVGKMATVVFCFPKWSGCMADLCVR